MTNKFEKLKLIISQNLGVDVAEIQESSDLAKDLGADSLDALHLIHAINDSFNIQIDPEEVAEIKTVGDLLKQISKN